MKDMVSSIKILHDGLDHSAQNAFTSQFFSEDLVKSLSAFIDTESEGYPKRCELPPVPYLGVAQCMLITKKAGAKHNNPALAKQLEPVLLNMLDEILKKVSSGAIEYEKELALLSVFLLKYFSYCSNNEKSGCNKVLLKLATLTTVITKTASTAECQCQEGVWQLMPKTLLTIIAILPTKKINLNAECSEEVLASLDFIMKASLLQGDFDIAAATVSLTASTVQCFTCYQEAPQVTQFLQQVPPFFHMLHQVMTHAETGSHTKVCTAQATIAIIQDLKVLTTQWSCINLTEDTLTRAEEAANKVLKRLEDDLKALDDEIQKSASAARKKEKKAREKITAYRAQTVAGATEPEQDSTSASEVKQATAKPPKEPEWSVLLQKAVEQLQMGQLTKGKQFSAEALKAAPTKVDKACIYTCCGDAYLASCKSLIDKACYLGERCSNELQTMETIFTQAKKDYPALFQTRKEAEAWLRMQAFTGSETLARLAEKFPSSEAISKAATAISQAIDLYIQALNVLNECQSEELTEQAQYLIEIMEADMIRLHQQKSLISSAKGNLVQAMEIRPKILYLLGLYGEANEPTAQPEPAKLQRKNWFTTTLHQFKVQADELSELFRSAKKGQKNKLTALITQIAQLKGKAKGTEKTQPAKSS